MLTRDKLIEIHSLIEQNLVGDDLGMLTMNFANDFCGISETHQDQLWLFADMAYAGQWKDGYWNIIEPLERSWDALILENEEYSYFMYMLDIGQWK